MSAPSTSNLSPIMELFHKWEALRQHSNEKGIDDDELHRRCRATDTVMMEIVARPATDLMDFAAKLSCVTHFGTYKDLGGDVLGCGTALIREAAELCGHPDKVAASPLNPQAGGERNG